MASPQQQSSNSERKVFSKFLKKERRGKEGTNERTNERRRHGHLYEKKTTELKGLGLFDATATKVQQPGKCILNKNLHSYFLWKLVQGWACIWQRITWLTKIEYILVINSIQNTMTLIHSWEQSRDDPIASYTVALGFEFLTFLTRSSGKHIRILALKAPKSSPSYIDYDNPNWKHSRARAIFIDSLNQRVCVKVYLCCGDLSCDVVRSCCSHCVLVVHVVGNHEDL